ncbi:MAG: DUF4013 domain-containing protein [Alphaproteobacteria bacterium]|nr:DUF4013 domain-containing protein [Alphaproteobacteria bacterium]
MSDPVATRPAVDLGASFGFVLKDKAWISKVILPGLLTFIPILGPLALLGWERRIYHQIRAGQEDEGLPAMDIGDDIAGGVAPAVALLNLFGPLLIFPMLFAMFPVLISIGEAAGNRTVLDLIRAFVMLMTVVGGLGFAALSFGAGFLVPELLRRGFNGEATPALRPRVSVAAIQENPMPLIVAALGMMGANFVGSLGWMACGIGLVLTVPFAVATNAHITAQWARVAEAPPPTPDAPSPPPNAVAWRGNR